MCTKPKLMLPVQTACGISAPGHSRRHRPRRLVRDEVAFEVLPRAAVDFLRGRADLVADLLDVVFRCAAGGFITPKVLPAGSTSIAIVVVRSEERRVGKECR